MKTKVLIVPGSCSSETNWFDQLVFFKKRGIDITYINLPDQEKTLNKACKVLINRLSEQFKESPDSEFAIVTHSMGGIQVLNILSQEEKFRKFDNDTFEKLRKSKIFFTQVPLKQKGYSLDLIKLFSGFASPFTWLWSKLLYKPMNMLIWRLEELLNCESSLFKCDGGLISVNLVNNLSIPNTVLGCHPKRLANLTRYYTDWDITDNVDDIARVVDPKNCFFSYGGPDLFADEKRTKKFAKQLGANVIKFSFSLHVPMHFSWNQPKFHNWILSNIGFTETHIAEENVEDQKLKTAASS